MLDFDVQDLRRHNHYTKRRRASNFDFKFFNKFIKC